MKLFRVTCRGMHDSHGSAYVVASDATRAYDLVREYLNLHNLGFDRERELQTVELLADEALYPDCQRRLYVEVSR